MEEGPVGADALRAVITRVFEKLGMGSPGAAVVADALVWADLRGLDTHGVSRLPRYVERIEAGEVDPSAAPTVTRHRAAVATVAGNRSQGQLALRTAADEAVAMAREAGVGWVSIRDASHAGAIGYFTHRIARERMAALAVGASRPVMLYHGSRAAGAATNPLAIAVPAGNGRVVSVDMAASTVSRGLLQRHRRTEAPLEPGWAVDASGHPTCDPTEAVLPTPLGGPKGSGMATLFECLANVTAGMPLIEPTLSGRLRHHAQGGAVLALDVEAFRPFDAFAADVDALADALRNLPPAEGHREVLAPGDRGDRIMAARNRTGIPLDAKVRVSLQEIVGRLGVEMPG
ncbi:Ldh family oxidoreductase [Candidatus Poriferisocius sp.]|uniref:Ldh family oxidoreductase n=1 Tax=Candidatus Poriferisocius sp. TaxID=3101276 RepID=UPI003B5B6361